MDDFGYGFLIRLKNSGCDSAPVYRAYREEGEREPWSCDSLEELAIKYEELLNKYSKDKIIAMHQLAVALNPVISEEPIESGD